MPVELVVFDIAGTTVKDNGEIARAFQLALEQFGYQVPVAKINPLMGYRKPEAIEKILHEFEPKHGKVTSNYVEQIHEKFLQLMLDYYNTTTELTPLPNVEAVFATLKDNNIKIALDTGFSDDITAIIVERLGWLNNDIIDFVISSNQVAAGRPDPFMIHEIMQRLHVFSPSKVIKVGDTEVDIAEGKNAGCLYSIGVTTGAFTREELAKYNPSFIIDDMQELIGIIKDIR